ncbi:HSF-type DNA-binding-domain-containing protein [Halteromyces radiatus]|uniref:HSF-type DNA-binding-domain-containing protein n=1 Tax=Halteromyces radiatus TaxID=101107 RepID=UPI00221FC593|nr:HSF-type DNA-binding-domain-containing protein [Halteromyces radiatus]KAI8099660.1 HSF-type DNA-binding-domain-containing protein [Halteromyces radiatus]
MYHDHTSPMSSPLASPIGSPYQNQGDWDQLQSQFSQQMSLQPPNTNGNNNINNNNNNNSRNNNNTFVHKLHTMVGDIQYQHLIAWTYSGTSFIVCNITEFSRDVLPKHFKHNNFSSFVRQLNMYGFHKVNKSPRGHRTLAENQIWEFSHSKFLRGRADLLDEIKRKALETDLARREHNGIDMNSHMTMMQMAQSDMRQQLVQLQSNFTQIVKELEDTRKQQSIQMDMLKGLMQFMSQQLGAPLPPSLTLDTTDTNKQQQQHQFKNKAAEQPPPIYITSHDTTSKQESYYVSMSSSPSNCYSSPSSPQLPTHHRPPSLTVQTHNLQQSSSSPSSPIGLDPSSHHHQQQPPLSPASSVNSYHAAVNTPLPPSPSPGAFFTSEDDPALYSNPHSPHTPFLLDQSPEAFNQRLTIADPSFQATHF